jgi:hypothetical protein
MDTSPSIKKLLNSIFASKKLDWFKFGAQCKLNDAFFDDTDVHLVLPKISKGITVFSKPFTKQILLHPTTDKAVLENRQYLINSINSNEIQPILQQIKSTQESALWFLTSHDKEVLTHFNQLYYENKLLSIANTSSYALSSLSYMYLIICPLLNFYPCIGPIKFMISTGFKQLFLIAKLLVQHLCSDIMSLGLLLVATGVYSYTMYNTVISTKKLYDTLSSVKDKVSDISSLIESTHKLLHSLHTSFYSPGIQESFDVLHEFIICKDSINASLMNPSGYDGHGGILNKFNALLYDQKTKDALITIIQHVGYIDHLYSMNHIMSNNNYTFPTYIESNKPIIDVKDMWNPSISRNVPNSIQMERSIFVSGSNAGGKSTFIKNILLNILLSQSIGISNASSCSLTPFKLIHTHINIPDLIGSESLFEAEVNRIFNYVYDSERLSEGEFGLGVFDEILSSTNVTEGISIGMAICEKFSKMTNNLNIITTHFEELTKNDLFDNYRVCVTRENNDITFPYKVERGVAKDKIAIELLRKKGFDNAIIDRAIEIKDTFLYK